MFRHLNYCRMFSFEEQNTFIKNTWPKCKQTSYVDGPNIIVLSALKYVII